MSEAVQNATLARHALLIAALIERSFLSSPDLCHTAQPCSPHRSLASAEA